MRKPITSPGFMGPVNHMTRNGHGMVAVAELVASLSLILSTLVAVTAVSIGIARADVVGNVIDNESGLFAIALGLGLLFVGMGGLTVMSMPRHKHKKT